MSSSVNGRKQSDEVVVVKKPPNEREQVGLYREEAVERRASVEGNPSQRERSPMQSGETTASGLERVRQAAKKDRNLRFTNLMHHLDVALLLDSYQAIRRDGAVGLDGQTWHAYGKENLMEKLQDLHERLQSGRFRATASKRVWIPKADGKQRPLGIPSLEDKIVQQALKRVLEAIGETEFKGFSYGFRPGRSGHQALNALIMAIQTRKVSWVLDADIEKFFDNVQHEKLMHYIEKRVQDKRILQLIHRFLVAGVSEEGRWQATEKGTPQGGILSPLLANIFLHYTLDDWVTQWRRTKSRGEVYIVRYADDFAMCFQYQGDAKACWAGLREQLGQAGLKLHPEKTKLIEFGRFAEENRKERGVGKPETFDFLGFTHICGRRLSDKKFSVQRKTSRSRLRKKVKEVREQLLKNRHRKVVETANGSGP